MCALHRLASNETILDIGGARSGSGQGIAIAKSL